MRTVPGLILMAGLSAGCQPAPPPPSKYIATPSAGGWEMDPAKHVIPDTPLAGRRSGVDVAPTVRIEGDMLSLGNLKDRDGRTAIFLITLRQPGQTFDGLTLVVRPDQPRGPAVPDVSGSYPFGWLREGYSLTLDLGRPDKDRLPGRMYLSLPGPDRDFLAGTFTALRYRSRGEPPGDHEIPCVTGRLTLADVGPFRNNPLDIKGSGPDVTVG